MHPYLGLTCKLTVSRINATGAWLRCDGKDEVLLPGVEIPQGIAVGAIYDGFVYLDSEDRPIATLKKPRACLGEVALMRAVDVSPMGCFVDWGLPKDLLVRKFEQTQPMLVGQAYFIAPYIDGSGRLAGTMKISSLLTIARHFRVGDWVAGVAYRHEPKIGLFVILERRYIALLPAVETHPLRIGDEATFRIGRILGDGKQELSLRKVAQEAVIDDAERLVQALHNQTTPQLSDATDPQVIRSVLGMSKKAFKRAAARLLEQGVVTLGRGRELRLK